MHKTASAATEIESVLMGLDREIPGVEVLQDSLVPVLDYLEDTSVRSVLVCLAVSWLSTSGRLDPLHVYPVADFL